MATLYSSETLFLELWAVSHAFNHVSFCFSLKVPAACSGIMRAFLQNKLNNLALQSDHVSSAEGASWLTTLRPLPLPGVSSARHYSFRPHVEEWNLSLIQPCVTMSFSVPADTRGDTFNVAGFFFFSLSLCLPCPPFCLLISHCRLWNQRRHKCDT